MQLALSFFMETNKMVKIFEWRCPECNKEIISMHKGQFEFNKKQHIKTHQKSPNTSSGGGS